MLAIATLLVVVLLSLLVTRVGEVAFTLTGLSPDAAKFQARSAFSSTGLGTSEAEAITSHPARRRIAMTLMLLGNAGLVTTVASLSVALTEDRPGHAALAQLGALIVGLFIVLVLARSSTFEHTFARVIERLLRRYTDLDVRDYHGFLHLAMDYAIDRIPIGTDHWLAGRTLASSRMTDEEILVLGVERHSGFYVGAPTGQTMIEAGDTVLVYGTTDRLRDLKERHNDEEGEASHIANVAETTGRIRVQRSEDRSRRWQRRLGQWRSTTGLGGSRTTPDETTPPVSSDTNNDTL